MCGIDKMEEYIQKSSPLIEDLEKKAYLCENERRKLHNKLQVYFVSRKDCIGITRKYSCDCSCSTSLRIGTKPNEYIFLLVENLLASPIQCISDTEIEVTTPKARYNYSFDMVFSSSSTQVLADSLF